MAEIKAVDHANEHDKKHFNPLKAATGGLTHGVGAIAGGVGSLTQSAGRAVLGQDAQKGAAVYVSRSQHLHQTCTLGLTDSRLTRMLRQKRKHERQVEEKGSWLLYQV